MINIVISNNGKIKIIGSNNSQVNLSDLMIYIPVELEYDYVNLLYVENNNADSCSLVRCENNGKYKTYKINNYIPFNVQTGEGKISIILINTQKHTSFLSDFVNISLSTENYEKIHQSAIIAELTDELKNMYEKTLAMTQLNMELLEQIKKGGDNT